MHSRARFQGRQRKIKFPLFYIILFSFFIFILHFVDMFFVVESEKENKTKEKHGVKHTFQWN